MAVEHPFTTSIPVQYRDLDPMGHVNNAVYGTYLEEARIAYVEQLLGLDLSAVGSVVASLSIDYAQPIVHGETVTVEVTVPRLGTSSIPMAYELRVDGDVVAEATSVQVLYDLETETPREIPDEWREEIESFEGL